MVRGVALRRQAARLDRVREDHGRAVAGLIGAAERVEEVGQVVPAEVADRGHHLVVVELADEPAHVGARAALARQPLAQLGGGAAQEALVLLVAHGVDALA